MRAGHAHEPIEPIDDELEAIPGEADEQLAVVGEPTDDVLRRFHLEDRVAGNDRLVRPASSQHLQQTAGRRASKWEQCRKKSITVLRGSYHHYAR